MASQKSFLIQPKEWLGASYTLAERVQAQGYVCEDACSSNITSIYPVQHVYWAKQTPYAEAILAECPGLGKTLFLDNEVQSSASDEARYHECLVHPAMVSAQRRNRVLIVGGGEGATLREVLLWPDVEHVLWVDIDVELVNACRQHLKWASEEVYTDPRVVYRGEDIRTVLAENHQGFDVILIDLPDPDISKAPDSPKVLQNVEFWRGIKRCLAPGGVFATHTGPVRPSDGYDWFVFAANEAGLSMDRCTKYHTVIPSFQDDWGFLLSCAPKYGEEFPFTAKFLTPSAFRYIFMWP
jgi:spermidine synthase